MPKNIIIKESKIIDQTSDESNDELTLNPQENKKTKDIKLNKSGKPKAPYVLTEARKLQFEIARNARMKNIESKKIQQNENYAQYDELKKELEKKKIKKLEKIKQKELVKLMAETDNISTDESNDEIEKTSKQKIKSKSKPKPKKIIDSDSDTDSELEQERPPRKPKRIQKQ